MQRTPNLVANDVINNIFQGHWQHERILRLNVAATPEHACVPYRGRPQPYPSPDEMVEHAHLSTDELPTPQASAETCYTEQELRALDPRVVQQEGETECARKGDYQTSSKGGRCLHEGVARGRDLLRLGTTKGKGGVSCVQYK
jgi:hypothetical protein